MYKLKKDPITKEIRTDYIVKTVNNGEMWIPTDESNADYQQYLKWVAEGNTPEPADSE
jgi:hypothetical protein